MMYIYMYVYILGSYRALPRLKLTAPMNAARPNRPKPTTAPLPPGLFVKLS